jgi:hypothetical protein
MSLFLQLGELRNEAEQACSSSATSRLKPPGAPKGRLSRG